MNLPHPVHLVKRVPLYLIDWNMSTPLPDSLVAAPINPVVVDNKRGVMQLLYGRHYLTALKDADVGYVDALVEGPLPIELKGLGTLVTTLEDLQTYFKGCRVRLRNDGLAFLSE